MKHCGCYWSTLILVLVLQAACVRISKVGIIGCGVSGLGDLHFLCYVDLIKNKPCLVASYCRLSSVLEDLGKRGRQYSYL